MSQQAQILSHLKAARVWDLRMAGWDIRTRRLVTRTGKRVALYYLNPQ